MGKTDGAAFHAFHQIHNVSQNAGVYLNKTENLQFYAAQPVNFILIVTLTAMSKNAQKSLLILSEMSNRI